MGSNTPEIQARGAPGAAADADEALRLSTQKRRQRLALALGLAGLSAAVLIALFGR